MERLARVRRHMENKDAVLIANRGEIAVRISRAVGAEGLRSVAVYGKDDDKSIHVVKCDEKARLRGGGANAYLDADDIIRVAKDVGASYVAPGYGFLSENANFAKLCEANRITFIGPQPHQLGSFGDKSTAKKIALECRLPVLPGTDAAASLEDALRFMRSMPKGSSVMVKALAGGGGRGMRAVHKVEDLPAAYNACRSEAAKAFGATLDGVYLERLVENARHIEVQVIGDGTGDVQHFWERDCTLQRRNQKIVEIAPAPSLNPAVRQKAIQCALKIATKVKLLSLATVEFLLEIDEHSDVDEPSGDPGRLFFMEVNPRIQVEHTVTEMISDVDLVRMQIRIARGSTLSEIGLRTPPPFPFKTSIQVRINAESLQENGTVVPSSGQINKFEAPSGSGIRLDTAAYSGYFVAPHFDSLLAKLIVTSSSFEDAFSLTYRALEEFFISGVQTNIVLLRSLLARPEVSSYKSSVTTRYIETKFLANWESVTLPRSRFFKSEDFEDLKNVGPTLNHEKHPPLAQINSWTPLKTSISGTVKEIYVSEGEEARQGRALVKLEAMKMEHDVKASRPCIVRQMCVAKGDIVGENQTLFWTQPNQDDGLTFTQEEVIDPDYIRPDLQKMYDQRSHALAENRPKAVQSRHTKGNRFVWENITDLFVKGSFVEYGSGANAAQSRRRNAEDLARNTVADGAVTGIGTIRDKTAQIKQRVVLIAYDYTVLAGTQGYFGHRKHDRLLQVADSLSIPVVLYGEGGGGRPGDVDLSEIKGSGLLTSTFGRLASLSGRVPLVAVVNGNCFAGNAALVGICDVIIATEKSFMGMAGPKMIEGGGLGKFKSEDIGPSSVNSVNGVIDILVKNEAEATQMTKTYLSYFMSPLQNYDWECDDQRPLRHIVPEDRKRVYNMRAVIEILADRNSVLELRPKFGNSLLTFLIRLEGRAVGVIASNPNYLGGAINSDSADKGARFMVLCDAFNIPIITLIDTPGFMVGPDAEKCAQVRHFGRLFVASASCKTPFLTIIVRKAIGLGAQAILKGDLHAPMYTGAWPTASLAPMGIEGGVQLGFKHELEAISDDAERQKRFQELVEESLERGSALRSARLYEVDEVIDPSETRERLLSALKVCHNGTRPSHRGTNRSMIDTW